MACEAANQVAIWVVMNSALKKAIAIAGSSTALARQLGISRQAVEQWRDPPAKQVLRIEHLTGVSRYDLRPDIYGPKPRDVSARFQAA